uniref:ANK_REP_REGION domain-containing protein n=1 Tax=Heterorhabditis bacteriophora TaxID=37862 RepID=A0A1I7X0H7_HETBA
MNTNHQVYKEPNLLKKQKTGTSNFYMLGHATRVVQIARGGRDGTNAFLNYESRSGSGDFVKSLIEKGITYKNLMKLSTIPNSGISKYEFDNHVVTATRMGLRELASALAEGPAKCHMNELHRATLKTGNNLPERILPISVIKKGFRNRNITPLHTAAINPNVKVLERLYAIDQNPNIGDQDNWLVIHYAAVCESPEPLKFLLKCGIPFTTVTKQLETPLHVASRAGRSECIEVLLKSVASLEILASSNTPEQSLSSHLTLSRNRDGNTALHLAVLSAVKSLLSNSNVLVDYPSSANHDKLTPLMVASSKGYLSIAETLISHGALIEASDKKKRTPLMHAVLNGQHHVAAMLISKGADILKKDSSGNTASHFAAAYGWLECLKALAAVEPTCLGQENDWKITPLSIAYLKGHYGIVTWLLDGNYSSLVNINGKDMNGVTLFSSLLKLSDEESYKELPNQIQYLLDKCFDSIMNHGASLNIKNQEGLTPLHIALSSLNLVLFKWMLALIHDLRSLFSTKWLTDGNILHHLLAFPMFIWTAKIASHKEYYDIFPILEQSLMYVDATKMILQATKEHHCTEGIHNAILYYETNNGEKKEVRKTLLMLIIEMKQFDLIKHLQLSQKDWTAVDITNAVMEPIEWLVTKGDVSSQDVFGRTALHYTFGSHLQCIQGNLNNGERDPIAVVSLLSNFMNKDEINLADNNGNTVLHLAAISNSNISAVTLIKKGSDVTIKNKDGNTPLSLAVLFGKQMVALTLIQADSCVSDAVFLPKPDANKDQLEWIWKGALKRDNATFVSTIPTEVVSKGSGWEAMVYVLLSTLNKV